MHTFHHVILDPMKYWVQAMEDGPVHVDAVNEFGETFADLCVRTVRLLAVVLGTEAQS